jgi:hypothetical protein
MFENQDENQVLDDTASKINAFKKAREIEQNEFDVYVYRIVQDTNKKTHNPFLTKYQNYLPDEAEIAEKFRAGRYKLQAIWYEGKSQKSQSWSYEIDEAAFPVQSASQSILQSQIKGSDPTQTMMLMVADIVKAAYTTRAPIENDFTKRDPLEMFSEVNNRMQEMYSRMMEIQSGVMEQSFKMNLEKRYGLINGAVAGDDQGEDEQGEGGIMGSGVVEIVKQVVDAAKMILPMLSIPGSKPVIESIKNNPSFSKYAELAKNPVIVREVAQALRKEYGDNKAGLLLKSFGIQMVARPAVVKPQSAALVIPIKEVPGKKVSKAKKPEIKKGIA